ncbi:hypothetical protein KSP40_PGU015187 [Platanthera guangdongensis]|uniref:Fe2OG dioxygenase domain-containing protein n=1 Tax=Platanthera guangdongensis TaxID=2320717 RepID=A0ABR2LDD1_9ASPA
MSERVKPSSRISPTPIAPSNSGDRICELLLPSVNPIQMTAGIDEKAIRKDKPEELVAVLAEAKSRHLEVQLLCDQYENVAALHSRDCSVGALDVTCQLFKAYFKLGTVHLCRSVIRSIETAIFFDFEEFPSSYKAAWKFTMKILSLTLAAEYGKHMIRIVRTLFHSLALDLKLDPSLSDLYMNASSGIFRSYRYPCLPECQSYMGMRSHTDSSVLAVVDEDEVGGLQIQQGNTWFSIMPVPDTLIVNIGDMMQVISNDEYRSVDDSLHSVEFSAGLATPQQLVATSLLTSEKKKNKVVLITEESTGSSSSASYKEEPHDPNLSDSSEEARRDTHGEISQMVAPAVGDLIEGEIPTKFSAQVAENVIDISEEGEPAADETKSKAVDHSSEYMIADSEIREGARKEHDDVCDEGNLIKLIRCHLHFWHK